MLSATTRLLVVLLSATLAVSGCSEVKDRVDGVREGVEEAVQTFRWCTSAFRLGVAVSQRDLEKASAAVDDLQLHAPDELRDELGTIVAAVDRAQEGGDLESLATDEVRAAGEAVLAHARERCDPSTDDTGATG